MTIGRVLKDSYESKKDGKTYPQLVLDVRTITVRKKFNINLNKHKYPTGKLDKIKEGCEDFPDYLVFYNVNGRGESLSQVHVGNIDNDESTKGVPFKKGFIFDPFVQKEPLYFTMHGVDESKKSEEAHIYNVVAHIPVTQNL